jgi:hypothetical protein
MRSDDIACARAAWREEAKTLTGLLTVDRVRSLSRWARQQTTARSSVAFVDMTW